uniref:uncharacterized protein C4orf51 homolog n=1 Tax=Jaculus jaculus TaxID=51337 RepID=UPI001E1B1138|nr:uncharacterized protein C4orf51 homolog [Jaculus jaculus]
MDVKHKVAHQIWGFSNLPSVSPIYGKLYMRPKQPDFDILMNYKSSRTNFLKQLQRHRESESKLGSWEDSEVDRYPDYYGSVSLFS